ncbi:MAG: AI-2E family transporter [Myxococcota bacterium]|jgi:predicted PurR-regulated permease PerM|nr:AI-2E family transporter [Myxococcota bacterium]
MDATSKPLFPRWAVAAVAILAFGALVVALRNVLTPIFFAFLIAYMLDPVVDRLEKLRLPRAAAIVVLLTVVLAVLVLFLLLVVPTVVRDVSEVLKELPTKTRELLASWEPVLEGYGIAVPHSLSEAFEQLSAETEGVARQAVGPLSAMVRGVVGGTANALGAVAALLIVPVFAFYLLYDFDRMTAGIHEQIPPRHRDSVVALFREIDEVIAQFVRGQVLVMLALAVLYAVGYKLVGVRLAVPIGIVAGLLSFIPYVGGATALGLALLMCAFDYQGLGQLGGVVAVYAVIQFFEGFVITPKIVGDKVGLSAVWVLFALMVAGELLGFLGILLAVPAAAVVKIFVIRGVKAYRASRMFTGGADLESGLTSVPALAGATPLGPPDTGSASASSADIDSGSDSATAPESATAPGSAEPTESDSTDSAESDSNSTDSDSTDSDAATDTDDTAPADDDPDDRR